MARSAGNRVQGRRSRIPRPKTSLLPARLSCKSVYFTGEIRRKGKRGLKRKEGRHSVLRIANRLPPLPFLPFQDNWRRKSERDATVKRERTPGLILSVIAVAASRACKRGEMMECRYKKRGHSRRSGSSIICSCSRSSSLTRN